MKKAKITNIEPCGTWDSPHGILYKQKYTFSDGEVLTAQHKTEDSPFSVGDNVEYEITKENEYGKLGKVKRAENAGGYDNIGMQVGNALSNACLLVAHGSVPLKDLEKTVERLMEIGNSVRSKFS